jgi:hypothetical protein
VVAIAEKYRSLILESDAPDSDFPKELRRKHLLWMCNQIEEHAEDAPATKLHRWIGFVQAALLANRTLDLDRLKTMFDEAKLAHGQTAEDLVDHLDPTSSFEFDIGGQG